ncbi:Exonuclease, RNase T and DNA polymerase III [Acidothermus cellulolyticus 11B]|uniref:Oligoribonuclease n=1 Tax=Acidothermus cellulolyticus (strain ATCC 43068 / DSM 8971 / 11B) TaxID=351607 RepID=A0LVG1_ACIC1|nr:Exonuclease, RNase T and DNA polymerase III [Acidothermus cellulolyticus 11B]
MTDALVWIDCEMTGLDLRSDALIEVAMLITDAELNVISDGIDVVIKPPDEALASMPDVVRQMHTASGLLDELPHGVSLAEAEERLLGVLREYVPEAGKAPLCGNTIATDRAFLARDMPAVDAYLHYRMIDVSSIKELVRRWYPRVYFASPEKKSAHRALADIRESIDELRYYRETIFVPLPGPDSDTARAAAARILGLTPNGGHPNGERLDGGHPGAAGDETAANGEATAGGGPAAGGEPGEGPGPERPLDGADGRPADAVPLDPPASG